MTSIASLIYRSPRYADAVWDSAHEFTPELHDGRARFFFVANDPTDALLAHLQARRYPHVVQRNEHLSDERLRELGFDPPEYIRRVYQGWNRAIIESDNRLVLVNSDCMFSPGWFHALIEPLCEGRAVCSKLVERDHLKYSVFPGAFRGEFGDHPDRFWKDDFLAFADQVRREGTEPGGAYMPCAMYRATAISAGLYPEGNPKGKYGDAVLFSKLDHVTALASVVYHFKEGEMSE